MAAEKKIDAGLRAALTGSGKGATGVESVTPAWKFAPAPALGCRWVRFESERAPPPGGAPGGCCRFGAGYRRL